MSRWSLLVALALALVPAGAGAVDYTFNGFASVVGGVVISGEGGNAEFPRGVQTPAFIGDYFNGQLYEDGEFSLAKESRVGAQLNLVLTSGLSVVTQAVARSSTETVKIEWLYASWDLNPNWTLQAGRKRLPLYYYSEFQDVGVAYIWVRPPQALYGWEISNYNGASLRYSGEAGDWSLRASAYGGAEEAADAGIWALYDEYDQDSRWENILGADLEMSRDWFTGRLVYLQSDNRTTSRPDSDEFGDPAVGQTVLGLAMNADFGDWFAISEFNLNKRDFAGDGYEVKAPASQVGLGRRLGALTPFVSWSTYWEDADVDTDTYAPERFVATSLTLRYDLDPSRALKVQFDRLRDETAYDYVGDTNVLTFSLDAVF